MLFAALSFIGVTVWSNGNGSVDVFSFSLSERILKVLMTPAWTLRHILWPAKLRVHYQIREGDLDLARNAECLLCVVALFLCVVAGVWLWKQRQAPQLLLAVIYFVVMTLPTSGLVQHGVVSLGCDRYAYFPSAVLVPFGGYLLGKYLFGDESADQESSKTGANFDQLTPAEHNECLVGAVSKAWPSRDLRQASRFSTKRVRLGLFMTTLWTSTWLSTVLLDTWRSEQTLYSHSLR